MCYALRVRTTAICAFVFLVAIASDDASGKDATRHVGATVIGTVEPGHTIEDQLAKAEIVIRQHTRAENTEACANVCPVLDDGGQLRFTTQIVTMGARAWCTARRCPDGDAIATIHSHAFETFTAKWIDALHDPQMRPGKRISPGRTFSELDTRHSNVYLVLADGLLRWHEGQVHRVR